MERSQRRARQSRSLWFFPALAMTVAAFVGDYLTGSEISFSIFYLLGISLGTWFVGRNAGLVLTLLSTSGWIASYVLTGERYSRPHILYWNVGMEVAIFLAVTLSLSRVRSGLEKERSLAAELERAYRRLDREMTAVGDLQKSLLPTESPAIPGYQVVTHYATSTRAGGDYYDFFTLADGRIGILVADASGHGTPAAVLMAMTRVLLHTAPGVLAPPEAVLAGLNLQLVRAMPDARFVTACYAVLDPGARRLDLALAGHNPPLLVRSGDGAVEELSCPAGPPLGLFPDAPFVPRVVTLQPEDSVLFYTDGLTEAIGTDGELFGEERARGALAAGRASPPPEMLEGLIAELKRHAGSAPASDDLTLILLRALTAVPLPAARRREPAAVGAPAT